MDPAGTDAVTRSAPTPAPRPTSSRGTAVRIALILSLAVVVLGSVRFARYDWSHIPFDRHPLTMSRVVSDRCTEYIGPYTTESGRVIKPIGVDDQQYMSLVELFRGTPKADLQVTCLLDPFASRPAMPWLAHWLPFDEGVSIALVNLAMVLIATWATVFALRAQGFSGRVVAAAGILFAVGWNTFFFSTVLLLDAATVGLVAVAWYVLAIRRPWWLVPLMFVAYPFKETIPVVVLPVAAVWAWCELRAGRRSLVSAAAPVGVATLAAVAGVLVSRAAFVQGDATWQLAPTIGAFFNNLFGPIGVASFLLATVPLFGPALLAVRRRVRADGWLPALVDPAVVGVAITAALCLWVMAAADLSPRFAWAGFPFAASLAAVWWSDGRPREWLDGLRLPRWIDDPA